MIAAGAHGLLHRLDRGVLRVLAAFLGRDADQHVGLLAEFLQADFAEAQFAEGDAHVADIGGALCANFDQNAAFEIDTEVKPLAEQQNDRDNGEQAGKGEQNIPPPQKRNVC